MKFTVELSTIEETAIRKTILESNPKSNPTTDEVQAFVRRDLAVLTGAYVRDVRETERRLAEASAAAATSLETPAFDAHIAERRKAIAEDEARDAEQAATRSAAAKKGTEE